MKKIISSILVLAIMICACLALASCGGDIESGTYKSESRTFEVDGNKIILINGEDKVIYKYELKTEEDSEKQIIVLDFHKYDGDNEQLRTFYENADDKAFELSFETTSTGFKMDGVEYKKQ